MNNGSLSPLNVEALAFFDRWRGEYPRTDELMYDAFIWLETMKGATRAFFHDMADVILAPAWPTPAPVHGQYWKALENIAYTVPYNASQVPAAVVPAGMSSDGMPITVQVIAGHGNDHLALAVAEYIESQEFGGYRAPRIIS